MATSDHSQTTTPEYLAIRANYQLVIDTVKAGLGDFCDALFEKHYISTEVRDYIRTVTGVSHTDKARKLVDTVIDRIPHDPSMFNGLVELFRCPSSESTSQILQETYEKELQKVSTSIRNSIKEPTSFEISTGFVCPYCSECSIERFYSEEGCPQKTRSVVTNSLFPCLDTAYLDEEAIIDLQDKLILDTQKIREKFSSLSMQITESLERQKPLETIKLCILSLGAFLKDDLKDIKLIELESKKEIQAAKCLADVFSTLHAYNYISFFNYHILEHVIKQCGSDDDQKRLEEYLAALREYCQRNIFEIPPSLFLYQSQTASNVLVFKYTKKVVTLEEVQTFRREVAQILGLRPAALQLCSIKKGCVQLHFKISATVAGYVLPVSSSQQEVLNKKGARLVLSFEIAESSKQDEDSKAEEELSSYLLSCGLDNCYYWLQQLKELGVQSKESLVHFKSDPNNISELIRRGRTQDEEKNLYKLLNLAIEFDFEDEKTKDSTPEVAALKPDPDLDSLAGASSLINILKIKTSKPKKKLSKQLSFIFEKQNKNAYDLLKRLELFEYYPQGLCLQDALCIKRKPLKLSLDTSCLPNPQQLPDLILQKLMAYDSRCRSDLMPVVVKAKYDCQSSEESDSDSDNPNSNDSNKNVISSGVHSSGRNSRPSSSLVMASAGIHPVDCLLSLILCSDDILRQDLFSRLAKCQLAIPFILPDPFTKQLTIPLWGLRSIIKEWECNIEKGEKEKKTQPIISYKMPLVTFIRLGNHQKTVKSKSAILNEVISDSDTHHFFHRDCDGGSYNLVLGDGLVDMCWYLPHHEESNNTFPDTITFLNLHGDAREHLEQMKFLSQISSMCFVLLTEEDLELDDVTAESLKRFGSSEGGITVLSGVENIPRTFKKKALISLENNLSTIKKTIHTRIEKKINFSTAMNRKSIEDWCDIEETTFLIDEQMSFCKEVLNDATVLITDYQQKISEHRAQLKKPCCIKDTFLPLQGEKLWIAWAAKDKEKKRQLHRGKRTMNQYTEEIKSKKRVIRQRQLGHLTSLTPIMKFFITSLMKFEGKSNRMSRNYFLQCLKLKLDNISKEKLSKMQHQYQSARKNLTILQQKKGNDVAIVDEREKIEALQKDIINSSFGLEHLLREIGQVYEAAVESKLYRDNLSRLPKAAAELLIDGYPLELMDGDAAHVPLQWVTAVLDETTKMLGDPNVFVLSVLGLQSTGKSTLLNTVFGLQFNVSAGRCTRGAFMQLLPFDDEIKKQTSCSYILVVDTEGLRAPQLDPLKTQKHDNELATFVIGLANMTLINIYGEVPGDMDDILQTSVHAFIRMSQVKLSPSCQFVHQNAGNNLNSEVGRAKFTDKLNQFTVAAAKHENCEGKFKYFNDVIKFNDQTDVHHFPGLWKGDPPMAPVNPGYSRSAQKLKLHFVETLKKDDSLCLSSFKDKIQNLWKALLTENFVFSFKNIQEITAYNSLETEYSKWDWEIREAIRKWEQVAENKIKATKVEHAAELARQKCKELWEHVSNARKSIREKIETFFSGKQSEILVQWKEKTEKRLEDRINLLREQAERHCMRLGESKEAISQFEQNRKSFAAKITGQVPICVASIKQKEQEEFHELVYIKQKLNPDQTQKILKREIFTPEKLKSYEKQNLIKEKQVKQLQRVIESCNGPLTEVEIHYIMFSEILTLEQVEQILLKGRQTTEELEIEFEKIWTKCIKEFEFLVPTRTVDVNSEVESAMESFVRTKGYEGKLVEKREKDKKPLKDWGADLEFHPKEKVHYNKVKAWSIPKVGKLIYYVLDGKLKGQEVHDPCQAEAILIRQRAIEKALDYLNLITKQQTDFKTEFTQDLLERVDSSVTEEAGQFKDHLTITHEFRLTLFLVVCGHAIPKFIEMANSFAEETNPLRYLERHVRKLIFVTFKNQYYQIEAEEAVVSNLCACLEDPIKNQIKQTIGASMVGQMKATAQHFSSKMALKVKILADLYEEDNFEGYLAYLIDVKACLQERIKQYTVQYCDQRLSDGTILQISVKAEVNRLIQVVKRTITKINKPNIHEWLTSFSADSSLSDNLGYINIENLLTGLNFPNELILDDFRFQIQSGLDKLKKTLHATYGDINCEEDMTQWRDKPHDLLADLIGCTEQCPFCGEQCDLQNSKHYNEEKHRTVVHRPSCLAGWRFIATQEMTVDFCTSLVASERQFRNEKTDEKPHPYKQYTSIYPEWSIPPDPSADTCLYWKWFVGNYIEILATRFKAKPTDVPSDWSDITWPEIKESLEDAYKVEVPSSQKFTLS